jgi:hypothetical protein
MVYGDMDGYADNSDWAFQWYTGERFHFICNTSGSYNSSWDTPLNKNLFSGYEDEEFKVNGIGGVHGDELVVKNVQTHVHGVYTCKMYNRTGARIGHTIYGLNIHDVKYYELFDKYRSNLIVAVVSTAVYIGLLGTVCLVWRFRYQTEEDKQRRYEKKRAYIYMTNGREHEMKQQIPDDLTEPVKSPVGKGAYENPYIDISTQL